VSAGHFEGNLASGRVQQKCGLQYEGTYRQAFLKNGRYIDEAMYAILREDWEKQTK
jgi:ribosomal-protein-alanine N-acetyltransferase